ncbi:MAG: hypothetical protein JKY65_14645 [Planctomycetes bacterium]|nr:hypothetical protein [Planctomycetota bacterium]
MSFFPHAVHAARFNRGGDPCLEVRGLLTEVLAGASRRVVGPKERTDDLEKLELPEVNGSKDTDPPSTGVQLEEPRVGFQSGGNLGDDASDQCAGTVGFTSVDPVIDQALGRPAAAILTQLERRLDPD